MKSLHYSRSVAFVTHLMMNMSEAVNTDCMWATSIAKRMEVLPPQTSQSQQAGTSKATANNLLRKRRQPNVDSQNTRITHGQGTSKKPHHVQPAKKWHRVDILELFYKTRSRYPNAYEKSTKHGALETKKCICWNISARCTKGTPCEIFLLMHGQCKLLPRNKLNTLSVWTLLSKNILVAKKS